MIYIYIAGAVLDLPIDQYSHSSPIPFKDGWIGCSDELVDPKRTPGDFFFSNGITFHHHFFVNAFDIDTWLPQFFMHNIFSTTGV